MLAADPANALTRNDLGYTHKRIADFLANLEDHSPALLHRALTECRKSIAVLEEIKEDAADAGQRFKRTQAYEYLGYADVALAESPKVSASEAREHMSEARDMFRQALNVLEDLRRRGTLDANNDEWAKASPARSLNARPL